MSTEPTSMQDTAPVNQTDVVNSTLTKPNLVEKVVSPNEEENEKVDNNINESEENKDTVNPGNKDTVNPDNKDTQEGKEDEDADKINTANQELADEVDDLFGDDDEEEVDDNNNDNNSNDDDTENSNNRRRYAMDEEEEMYTRKFYGDDAGNMSENDNVDDHDHHFEEQDVELVRRVVPYKVTTSADKEDGNENHSDIYHAKVPAFLTIDPIPFDPPSFEKNVKERLNKFNTKNEQIDDGLIDEHTIRWRYSRDSNQKVFRESNTQIVQWSDGSFSLKLGDEYTDILINDTDNTFMAVSHDQQELMQCVEGGEVKKTIMFIPTSTNSKIHQRLSKAVTRRNQRTIKGPGTYIINVDPEIEKKELEKKQTQIFRERRRRQMKERELMEESENGNGGFPDSSSPMPSYGNKSQKRSRSNRDGSKERSDEPREYSRRFREDEYEDDGFLVDDDEEEEYNDEADDLLESGGEREDEEEEEEIDEEEEERQEKARAERLAKTKKSSNDYYQTENKSDSNNNSKRRKIALISDDESE